MNKNKKSQYVGGAFITALVIVWIVAGIYNNAKWLNNTIKKKIPAEYRGR